MQNTEEQQISFKHVAIMIANQLGEYSVKAVDSIINIVYILGVHQSYKLANQAISIHKKGGMLTKAVTTHKNGKEPIAIKNKVYKKTVGGIFFSLAYTYGKSQGKKMCIHCIKKPHFKYLTTQANKATQSTGHNV